MEEQIYNFLIKLLAYGGGSAAIAYLLFQHLGKSWLDNKFAQRLDELRHQQNIEVQRLTGCGNTQQPSPRPSGVMRYQRSTSTT